MADARLKDQLVTRRMTLLASLSRAENFISQFNAERDGLEVQIRLENLDLLWASLEEVQTTLEDMENTNEGKVLNLQYRASMEPRLFRTKAQLQSKLPSPITPPENRPQENPPRASSTLSGLRLPTISLPDFDGDYKQWLTFHDTFLALIHENPELPPIQKFHYLRAAVKGEAAQIIETIAISATNYQLAWQTLVARYSNKYLLKKRHLHDLLEIPRMKKETAAELHSTVDDFQRHIKILEQLGEPTAHWSSLLEHLLCIRLHDDTIRAWEDHAETVGDQTYKCLVEFLEKRIRVLESVSVNHNHAFPQPTHVAAASSPYQRRPSLPFKMSSHAVTESPVPNCHACDQHHPLVKCGTFEKMTLDERWHIVYSNRLCLNCFRHDHFARDCPSPYSCRVCKRKHHSMLHTDETEHANFQSRISLQEVSDALPPPEVVQCNSVFRNPHQTVFMLTAVLRIVDIFGREHFARALLDSASQPNLMSDRLAQLLRLPRQKANVVVQGIGENPEHATESVTTRILSRKNDFARDMSFLVLKRMVSNLPAEDVPVENWNVPDDVFLADPGFNRSSEIDLVIGTQFFFDCFPRSSKIQLSDNLPVLVDSVFGWIFAGGSQLVPPREVVSCIAVLHPIISQEASMKNRAECQVNPAPRIITSPEAELECKPVVTAATTTAAVYSPVFPMYRSFSRLVRIAAYCRKFIYNLRTKARTQSVSSTGPAPCTSLTVEQLSQTKAQLVKLAQADCFQDELRDLQHGRPLRRNSSIKLLDPFIDSEGILRVGGRLNFSEQPNRSKNPVLLPSFHPLAKLIAKTFHHKLAHGGGQEVLSAMREEYWPLQGQRLVRSITRSCLQCARANPVSAQQRIDQLPDKQGHSQQARVVTRTLPPIASKFQSDTRSCLPISATTPSFDRLQV